MGKGGKMKRITRFKKRTWVLLGIVSVVAAVASVGAYAFWTTSGSGNGTATTGTDHGVTVSGDPANGLYPGSNVAVSTLISNSSSTQPQYVTNLHVTISNDNEPDCDSSWFTYKADADVSAASNPHVSALNYEIPAAGSLTVPGKVYMANPNSNQDDCKTVGLTLDYQVNNTP
jgi:hypothetical protein